MAKQKESHNRWNMSQVVAHNMTKAREMRGFTQTLVAERMSRFTDSKWTKVSVAQAEGSVSGSRIRGFTAVELFALARTFDLPVTYFFAPPSDPEIRVHLPEGAAASWDYVALLALGHEGNIRVLGDQWADHAQAYNVRPPPGDIHGDDLDNFHRVLDNSKRSLGPESAFAAALQGLARRNLRGSPRPGEELTSFIRQLRELTFALEAVNNYPDATFIDPDVAKSIEEKRPK